jgi:hypothetical protein
MLFSLASKTGDDLPDSYLVLFRILYSITTGIEKSSIREIFFQAILRRGCFGPIEGWTSGTRTAKGKQRKANSC